MKNAPWLKFTTLSTPKISVSPTATRNSSIPMMKPLVVCVTRQAELARQPVSASRSKEDIRHGCRVASAEKFIRWRAEAAMQPPRSAEVSGVAFGLLPFGFKRPDLLPVAARDLWNIGLVGNRGAPTDGIADQGLVPGPHRHGAVGAERR